MKIVFISAQPDFCRSNLTTDVFADQTGIQSADVRNENVLSSSIKSSSSVLVRSRILTPDK